MYFLSWRNLRTISDGISTSFSAWHSAIVPLQWLSESFTFAKVLCPWTKRQMSARQISKCSISQIFSSEMFCLAFIFSLRSHYISVCPHLFNAKGITVGLWKATLERHFDGAHFTYCILSQCTLISPLLAVHWHCSYFLNLVIILWFIHLQNWLVANYNMTWSRTKVRRPDLNPKSQ